MIDKELIEILCCPDTKQDLTLVSDEKLIEIKNDPNAKYDALSYHAKQERYYIKINAYSNASVYTMKCGTGSIPPSLTGGGNSEPLPE